MNRTAFLLKNKVGTIFQSIVDLFTAYSLITAAQNMTIKQIFSTLALPANLCYFIGEDRRARQC